MRAKISKEERKQYNRDVDDFNARRASAGGNFGIMAGIVFITAFAVPIEFAPYPIGVAVILAIVSYILDKTA